MIDTQKHNIDQDCISNDEKNGWDVIANNYFDSVVSPFYNSSSQNRLYRAIDRMHNQHRTDNHTQNILEIGCGNGYLFKYLRDNHPTARIIAIDSSKEMIKNALKTSIENKLRIEILRADSTTFQAKDNNIDEIYAINSILSSSREDRENIIRNIHDSLKLGGAFYGLFPSNENFLQQASAMKERLLKEGIDEANTLQMIYSRLAQRRYDPIGGYIDINDSNVRIKLYNSEELKELFIKAGFKNIAVQKFNYPKSVITGLKLDASGKGIYNWILRAEKE